MQVFPRSLIDTHCPGDEWPTFAGRVGLGESFAIETERFNRANGPLAVTGVRAGEALAVHVEAIQLLPPFEAPNGGPFVEGMGPPVSLVYRDGVFHFPTGQALAAQPSIGNLAVLPEPTEAIRRLARADLGPPGNDRRGWGWRAVVNDPRGKHCHFDCRALGVGATLHLRAQVDEAGLCAADVHGYVGQGELAFGGIETAARLQLRVERSTGWWVDWPLIETADELIVCVSDTNGLTGSTEQQFVDVVREAYRAMRQVVAERLGLSVAAANTLVATALDLRPSALYDLANYLQNDGKRPGQYDKDLAVAAVLPKALLGTDPAGFQLE